MKKLLAGVAASIAIILALPAIAFAHVVVTPAQAGIGASAMFNVSVPNEKEVAVTSVKLDIPEGVQNVSPDVLSGWDITTTLGSTGAITSITWVGNIPVGQRADFAFKAQTPASATSLDWNAYQTYADGSVVHWDQNPATSGKAVKNDAGPYSITKVVNDLSTNSSDTANDNTSNKDTLALTLSIAALVLSIGGLFLRKK